MELKEAYRIMQEASGIEVGDKVRVMRKVESYEMGWDACWVDWMDQSVGQELMVELFEDDSAGIRLSSERGCAYPFFVLELVKKANTKKKITIDGKDVMISKESFEELKRSLAGDE